MMVDRSPPAAASYPHHRHLSTVSSIGVAAAAAAAAATTNSGDNDNDDRLIVRTQSVDTFLEEEEKEILHQLEDLDVDLFSVSGGRAPSPLTPRRPQQLQQQLRQQVLKEAESGSARISGSATAAAAALHAAAAADHYENHGEGGLDDMTAADDDEATSTSFLLQPPDSPCSSTYWRFLNPTANAVHMHIQENARLPTFNLPVNRKGSTGTMEHFSHHHLFAHGINNNTAAGDGVDPTGSSTGGGSSIASAGGTHHHHNNLTEMFLRPQDRFSYHASYAQAGALSKDARTTMPNSGPMVGMEISYQQQPQQPPTMHFSPRYNSNDNTPLKQSPPSEAIIDPLDLLASQVDPTPLSEIKRRHEKHTAARLQNLPPPAPSPPLHVLAAPAPSPATLKNLKPAPTAASATTTATIVPTPHPPITTANLHFYRRGFREYPLPIPTKNVSPPGSPTTTTAENTHKTTITTNDNHDMTSGNSVMADALATAAAIAAQVAAEAAAAPTNITNANSRVTKNPTTAGIGSDGSHQPQQQLYGGGNQSSAPPPLPAQQQQQVAYQHQAPMKHHEQQTSRNNLHRPEYTPAAIRHASKQRSHYGFGTNHVVPSVPIAPPHTTAGGVVLKRGAPSRTLSKKRPSSKTARSTIAQNSTSPSPAAAAAATSATVVATASNMVAAGPSVTLNQNAYPVLDGGGSVGSCPGNSSKNDDPQNTGVAYERKKQRAKDARVKLNESIERLSVAISTAGTQSQERLDQWKDFQFPAPASAALASQQEQRRQTGLEIMKDCVDTAETAKKWDRPCFVGSAAALIQGLNSQCEALMRSLVALHRSTAAAATGDDGGNQVAFPSTAAATGAARAAASLAMSENGKFSGEKRASPRPSDVSTTKRQRTTENDRLDNGATTYKDSFTPPVLSTIAQGSKTEGAMTTLSADEGSIFSQWRVSSRIASFLDPLSLQRCRGVSKVWHDSSVFSSEVIWQDLAAIRFGYFNVRQWRAKLEDEDEGVVAPSMTLYRSMDRANVMPNFQHEGMFLLGEARLPNKVSAWAFLVERSNGETLRSVLHDPETAGAGVYTSLPVVELRIVIQNTGCQDNAVVIREQTLTVDASTRRRGEQMKEIVWDDRFKKRVLKLDGSPHVIPESPTNLDRQPQLCRLRLFEAVVLDTFIHARGCSTNSKFVQRANFTKVLVGLNSGVTVPLVVPFPRDAAHLQH